MPSFKDITSLACTFHYSINSPTASILSEAALVLVSKSLQNASVDSILAMLISYDLREGSEGGLVVERSKSHFSLSGEQESRFIVPNFTLAIKSTQSTEICALKHGLTV